MNEFMKDRRKYWKEHVDKIVENRIVKTSEKDRAQFGREEDLLNDG